MWRYLSYRVKWWYLAESQATELDNSTAVGDILIFVCKTKQRLKKFLDRDKIFWYYVSQTKRGGLFVYQDKKCLKDRSSS